MFLTIVTRSCRPTLLKDLKASLAMQTDRDFEHVVIEDKENRGLGWANEVLRDFTPSGEFVWVVDDDDVLTDENIIRDLKQWRDRDVIIVQGLVGERVVPTQKRYRFGRIGGGNLVVRKELWEQYKEHWVGRRGGDWPFVERIVAPYNFRLRKVEFDRIGFKGVSHGGASEQLIHSVNQDVKKENGHG